jgi:CRP-like cAMP-binding protein
MSDFDPVIKYVERYIRLSEEEKQYLASLLRTTRVKKKQYIVQPDFTCKYRSYVVSGAMRAYVIDKKGDDHTIAFAIEDWWISDYNSYIFQTPASMFVEAVEDTVLIQIDYNAEQLLMETHPGFERFFRIITQRAFAYLQRRVMANLTMTAEERYEEFSGKYPKLANRFPQYAVASYLGFSSEFLSKIRNKRVKKS